MVDTHKIADLTVLLHHSVPKYKDRLNKILIYNRLLYLGSGYVPKYKDHLYSILMYKRSLYFGIEWWFLSRNVRTVFIEY